jgi:uncharacterized protein (TIGR03437 family)
MKLFLSVLFLAGCGTALAADVPRYTIEILAGGPPAGDGASATAVQLGTVQGVAVDRQGNLYFSETDNHRVRKVDLYGVITTLAGTGEPGFSGDGGLGVNAQLNLPYGLAVDLAGNVYIADLGNQRVRRVGPDGRIFTVAGTGAKGSLGDGGPALNAQLATPRNVAVDAAGNLYISEFEGHRIRQVSADGRIATAAGTGVAGFRGDGGQAVSAQLAFPAGVAVDRMGTLYIADSQNQRIRKVLPGGIISTVLGGVSGTALSTPIAVAVDSALTLYVADASGTVRSYSAAMAWQTVTGTGEAGYAGDGGPAPAAQLAAPHDLAVDLAGDLFIADAVRVREINLRQTISTVAGDAYLRAVGDGGPALKALLNRPAAVALDFKGNLYIADTGTARLRRVTAAGTMETLAGTGVAGYNGDRIAAAAAELNAPMGVAQDAWGDMLIADSGNQRIRLVAPDGGIDTYGGTGTGGMGQAGLMAAQTALRSPRAVCADRAGAVYIVDTSNHRVLRAGAVPVVTTVAGNGSPGDAGDGGAASLAQLNLPGACATDSAGDLFIADTGNHLIRKVSRAGIISTVAGNGTAGFAGDGGPSAASVLNAPRGIAVDDNGNIFIADTGNNRIRLVSADGTIRTVAGQSAAGFAGDGGAATGASLNQPGGMVLDGAGDLYFADTGNNRVRRLILQTSTADAAPVELPPALTVVSAASLAPGAVAPGETITIFGSDLGPQAGAVAATDASGLIANLLAGSEVRFDGVPAPLFYAQAGQINAQVPYTVAGAGATHVEVFYQGVSAGAVDLPVVEAAPALYPVAINQDGTLNGVDSPAPPGSIVTFFATGEGLTNGVNIAGKPAAPPYPRPALPVSLTIGVVAVQLPYAGSAPGYAGLLQINATLPQDITPGDSVAVQLTVGTAISRSIAIRIR